MHNDSSDFAKIELSGPSLCTFTFTGIPDQKICGSGLSSVKHVNIAANIHLHWDEPPMVLLIWLLGLANVKSLTFSSNTLQISVDVSSNSESRQHDKILEHPTSCEVPIPFRTSTSTKKYKYRLFPDLCFLEKTHEKTRVDVSSYIECKCYLNHCLTRKKGPVSFNVSDSMDSNDYKRILRDLIGSYKKSGRLDKVKHPRSNHLPLPAVTCATIKEMREVYHAIGPYYRVIIKPDSSLPPKQKNKRWEAMLEFSETC
ncbi:hypothetical protein MTR_4g055460 [Medicago truncatula]|uniref:Uncharacterized protein n=1 Tax=Medicago truncatula TaxID=3880 RepID=G7JL05_MEDTR|nr:hypothetical protein MTR_4g055460 [Medicago truncatula]